MAENNEINDGDAQKIKQFFLNPSYCCDFCSNQFRTVMDLTKHVQVEHKYQKALGCIVCTKRYDTLWELQIHYEKEHHFKTGRKKKTYKCKGCGEIFNSIGLQKLHYPKCRKKKPTAN